MKSSGKDGDEESMGVKARRQSCASPLPMNCCKVIGPVGERDGDNGSRGEDTMLAGAALLDLVFS